MTFKGQDPYHYRPEPGNAHRSVGDVVSAVSIRVPLSTAYAETNRISLLISGVLLFTLALLYAFQFLINRRLLFGPLNRIWIKWSIFQRTNTLSAK